MYNDYSNMSAEDFLRSRGIDTSPQYSQPDPVQQNSSIFGDVVDAAQMGGLSAFSGIANFFGADDLAQSLSERSQSQLDTMTDEGREGMQKEIYTSEGGFNSDAAGDLDYWLLNVANLAGQVAATAPLGGFGGKAVSMLGNATKVGKAAGAALSKSPMGSMLTGSSVGVGVVGGAAASGMAGTEAQGIIDGMELDELFGSDKYKDILRAVNDDQPDLSDLEKFETAKSELARQVNNEVTYDPKLLVANFAGSFLGDNVIAGAFKKRIQSALGQNVAFGSSRVGNAAKGFAAEGSSEAFQGGLEKYTTNVALNPVDGRDAMQGVNAAAINEGILGGVTGGGLSATGRVEPRQEVVPPADSLEAVLDTQQNDALFNPSIVQPATDALDQQVQQTAGLMQIDGNTSQDWQPNSIPLSNILESPVIEGQFEHPRQLPDNSDIIYAGDSSGDVETPTQQVVGNEITPYNPELTPSQPDLVMTASGTPFKTEKSLVGSKKYKDAVKEGYDPKITAVDGGFGWRVEWPQVAEAPAENIQSSDIDTELDDWAQAMADSDVAQDDTTTDDWDKDIAENFGTNEQATETVQNKLEGLEITEAPLNELTLSDDVPQFKDGADQDGVVEKLGGKFDRTGVAPIQVWVRSDGRKEVITGRHRLDLAKRSDETSIPAQYHYEDEGFTQDNASQLDAILNIRDNQGQVKDYVNYFQNNDITEQEAKSEGLLRQALGRRAYSIATKGSSDLSASHSAGIITDEAAERIANVAPNEDNYQSLGLKKLQEGKSIAYTENFIRAFKSVTGGQMETQTGDLFGDSYDTAAVEADKLTKTAVTKQREIKTRLNAIRGAAKNPKLAKAEGVDIKDPNSLNRRISELSAQDKAWDNWHTNPDLVNELRQEIGAEVLPVKQTETLESEIAPIEVNENQNDMFGEQDLDSKVADEATNDMFAEPETPQKLNLKEPAKDLQGEAIDKDWVNFADDTGTKKIPRAEMPQIKAEHRGAMVNFMRGRNITHDQQEVEATSLKPTQTEFSKEKVKKAIGFEGGDRSILVSSDNYVLDGHHQWLAKREKGESVKVIRLDAPIETLIPLAKEFPSSETVNESQTEQETKLSATGQAFKTEKSARASKAFKDAANPTIVPSGDGFGVQDTPETETTSTLDNKEIWQTTVIDYVNQKQQDSDTKDAESKVVLQQDLDNLTDEKAREYVGSIRGMTINDDNTVTHRLGKKSLRYNTVTGAAKKVIKDKLTRTAKTRTQDGQAHSQAVEAAIKSGKAVPSEVLADYPNLKQTEQDASTETVDPNSDQVEALATKVGEKIEDFGEKIEGAKKDISTQWAKEYTDDDIATLPLSKIWPKDSFDKLNNTFSQAFATAARQLIPAKPRNTRAKAKWVEQVKGYRALLADNIINIMETGDVDLRDNIMGKMRDGKLANFSAKVELLEGLEKDQWDRIGSVSQYKDAITYDKDGGETKNPQIHIKIDGRTKIFKGKGIDSVAQEVAKTLSDNPMDDKSTGGSPAAMKFEVRTRAGKAFAMKAGDKEYRPLKYFATAKEALDFVRNNNAELVAEWSKIKERDNVNKKDVRNKQNRPRTGADHRKGEDVTPEKFSESFGFRGVQFGNWVKQGGERQESLNKAYDALMDLAGIIGVPAKAISLNGELGLAFGARGNGSAMAHYEPGQIAINLTKTSGAGSLAHEFFHALDHYFQRQRNPESKGQLGRESTYVTYKPEPMMVHKNRNKRGGYYGSMTKEALKRRHEQHPNAGIYQPENWEVDPDHPKGIRPEVEIKFADLVAQLDNSPMVGRSLTIDKGKPDGYWSRIIERAARSFENYVISKMGQSGYNNDYLANVTSLDEFGRNPERYPYLLDSEIQPIEEAFDNLFNTIQTKEGDDGNIAMFSRTSSNTLDSNSNTATTGNSGAVSLEEANKVVVGVSSSWKGSDRASEFVVVDTFSELPPGIKQSAKDQGAEGQIKGVFHEGKTYLVLDKHDSTAELEGTIFHETYGHAGIRKMFGKELPAKLNQLFVANGGLKGLRATAKKYNIDLSEYEAGLADSGMRKETQQQILMDELLAHMQQDNTPSVKRMAMEVLGYIRTKLKAWGMKGLAELNDADLFYLLRESRLAVQKNMDGTNNKGEVRFSVTKESSPITVKAYHGTGAKFSEFDKGKLGSFTGAQSAQEGFFFTSEKGMAQSFQSEAQRKTVDVDGVEKELGKLSDSELEKLYVETGIDDYLPFDGQDKAQAVSDIMYELEEDLNQDSLSDRSGIDKVIKKYIGNALFENGETKSIELTLNNPLTVDFAGKEYSENAINNAIDKAKKDGNDGVIFKSMEDAAARDDKGNGGITSDVYFVFDAESTTESSNPMFSRASTTTDDEGSFTLDDETRTERAIRFVQDKFNRINKVQKTIKKAGINVSDKSDVYGKEALYYGKVEEDFRQLAEESIEPIAEVLGNAKVEQSEFDLYLYALHAPERNAYIQTLDETMESGSGMTDQEAAMIVEAVNEDTDRREAFYSANTMVRDMIDNRVEKMREHGLIDDDSFASLQDSYTNYVPLKGQANDDGGKPKGTGMGFNIGGRETIAALGRKSKAESPLLHAMTDTQMAITRGQKNEVGNAMLSLINEVPNEGLWKAYTTEGPLERKKGPDGKVKMVPMSKEKMEGLARHPNEPWVSTKRFGVTHYMKFEDKLMAQQMKSVGVDNGNKITQMLGGVNRFLSTMSTSANPEFLITNMLRDVQTAVFNVASETEIDDGKLKDVDAKELIKNVMKDYGKSFAGIRKALRDNDTTSEWGQLFDDFRKQGAKTGYFDMKDIEAQERDLKKLMLMQDKKSLAKFGSSALKFIEDYNSTAENAIRLSVYKNAIDKGATKHVAATLAKNLTVNFNRKGEAGTWLNSLYLFANAGIQGTANFARAVGTFKTVDGKKKLHLAQKAGIGMAGIAFSMAIMNRMIGEEDEDGENFWDKIPDHVKERNVVMMIGPKEYITVPLPYGYNVFANFGTAAESIMMGGKISKNANFLARAVMGSFLPLGLSEGNDGLETTIKTIMPQIGKPLVDLSTNTNFFGGRIYNDNNEIFGDKRSDAASGYDKTNATFKVLAMGLNKASGGTEYQSGLIDIHPETFRYLAEYIGGGAGRTALLTAESVARGTKGEFDATRTPFARRGYGEVKDFGDQTAFYDHLDTVETIEAEFKSLRGQERMQFRKENNEMLRLAGLAKNTKKYLTQMRKQKKRYEERGMKEQAEKLAALMETRIDRFNKQYNEVMD